MIIKFTKESSYNKLINQVLPKELGGKGRFYNFSSMSCIKLYESRKELETLRKSVKLENIPRVINIDEVRSFLEIQKKIKIVDITKVGGHKKKRNGQPTWSYSAYVTFENYNETREFINNDQWNFTMKGRDIRVFLANYAPEEREPFNHSVKLTGLKENMVV